MKKQQLLILDSISSDSDISSDGVESEHVVKSDKKAPVSINKQQNVCQWP